MSIINRVLDVIADAFTRHALDKICELHESIVGRFADAYRGHVMSSFKGHLQVKLASYVAQIHALAKKKASDSLEQEQKARRAADTNITGFGEALPLNARFVFRKGNEAIYVIEQTPRVASIDYMDGICSLSFPFVVFFVYLNEQGTLKSLHIGFRRDPIHASSDMLFAPSLPHIYENTRVCFTPDGGKVKAGNVSETVAQILAVFWGSKFHLDWPGEPKLDRWKSGTVLDENWAISRFPWNPARSINDQIQLMFKKDDSALPLTPSHSIMPDIMDEYSGMTRAFLMDWVDSVPRSSADDNRHLGAPFRNMAQNVVRGSRHAMRDTIRTSINGGGAK